MRLRVLETEAGTVLVLDRATRDELDAQRAADLTAWRTHGGPFVFTTTVDLEIPEVDRMSATDLMDMQTRVNAMLGRL